MTYKAIGIESGTVYATGSYPECIRQLNQQKHDEATKVIRANETYTPTTAEEETERLAKEWQLAELLERQRAEAEKAAREELRRTPPKTLTARKTVEEASKPIVAPRKKEKAPRANGWTTAEDAYVKTNITMPTKELVEQLAERFGKTVTDKAMKNRKNKLRKEHGLPARPKKEWTQEEDDYIIKNYHRLTAKEVGDGIGRTKGSVEARVRLLRGNGKLDYHQRYSEKQSYWSVQQPERNAGVHESGKHNDMGVVIVNKTDKHIAICAELKDIYEAKNTDYGNSFAKQLEEYGLVSAAIRLEDKLSRFKHLIGNEAKVDESIQDTLMDMANYAVMTLIEMEEAE